MLRAGLIRNAQPISRAYFITIRSSLISTHRRAKKQKYTIEQAVELINQRKYTPNCSYEVNINLNIEPLGNKTHKLRGVFDMPHPSGGRKTDILALTTNTDLAISALQRGAKYAGDLGDSVTHGVIHLEQFQRVIATNEMRTVACLKHSKLARKLKRNKMQPCVEDKTLVNECDFLESIEKYANNKYAKFVATEKGLIITTLGKVETHSAQQVAENLDYVLKHLYSLQPEDFGQTKYSKKKNLGKYVIGIHLTVSQVGSLPLNLEKVLGSVDDTSLYAI